MQIEVFTLCDAATSQSGKLNILGTFDSIWLDHVPAKHPQCTIALRLRFDKSEGSDHAVSVQFMDADGKKVLPPTNGKIGVRFPGLSRTVAANLIFNIQGLKLEKFGEHSISLNLDGKQRAALPLFVYERKKDTGTKP